MKSLLSLLFSAAVSISAFAAGPATTVSVFKLDPAASLVQWKGKKTVTGSFHKGTVPVKSGEVQVEKNIVKGGTVALDMSKLTNEDLKSDPKSQTKLLGHLASDDFFS